MFSLVYAATNTAYCYALISLELAESRILHAAPADTRPRTPLVSFCTVQLRTLCATRFLATLCLSTTSGPGPRELPDFWGVHGLPPCPIPQKGSGSTNIGKWTKYPHREMGKTFSPSYSSSQITYVEAKARKFYRFHKERIAFTASTSLPTTKWNAIGRYQKSPLTTYWVSSFIVPTQQSVGNDLNVVLVVKIAKSISSDFYLTNSRKIFKLKVDVCSKRFLTRICTFSS